VKAGEPVRFQVTSKEGLHGFSIGGTNVDESIDEGETKEVSWTPEKPGQYTIRCDQFCGSGHDEMSVTITVI
jgi:cytochrome c oxidase subunit 2